jgi:hypothetical protein
MAAVSAKVRRPRQGRFGFGHGRRMISATGRISFIAPAVCPANHYRLICHAKAEATSSWGISAAHRRRTIVSGNVTGKTAPLLLFNVKS